MIRELHRRLDRLQGHIHQGAPTRILADRPMEEEEAGPALEGWQGLVAAGSASLSAGVLCITSDTTMSDEEWVARYVTAH